MTVRRKTEKQYATESEYVHQWIRDPRVVPVMVALEIPNTL